MRHGLSIPPVGDLSDPHVLAITPDRLGEIVECVSLGARHVDAFDFAIWETAERSLAAIKQRPD